MQTVFVPRSFEQRLDKWERDDRLHIYALQLAIESIGWDAILSYPFCQIETVLADESGDIRQMDFWIKIRRDYIFLTLELRMPDVFVLHD